MALKKKPTTGMKDILPREMEIRDYVIGQIKETYRTFGFQSIETPCVEHIENLNNKQGGENEKLIFKILKRGQKLNLETAETESDLVDGGLRYDLTVPLSRYYANNMAKLPSPFKALQIGDINKVVPIDKSSTIITIILAAIILGESITLVKGVAIVLIAVGTFLMIEKKKSTNSENKSSWLLFAFGSALFAALTAILGKIGISGVESNLGTAIRTFVVLIMSWVMVLVTGKKDKVKEVPKNELIFICLSGIATGASWLCYYRALQDGLASVVVPVDKLSILVTILFSYIVFHEKLSIKSAIGLVGIVAGTLIMIL